MDERAFRAVWRCAGRLVAACRLRQAGFFRRREEDGIASLSLDSLPPLPPDTTNRFADLPAAAALGATLFFDHRLSRDGTVVLLDLPQDRPAVPGRPAARRRRRDHTNRRTMPLAGVAWNPWFFWDGRRDSLWAQALTPLEDPLEHAGNRTAYARFMAKKRFDERYERIFGPLPDLSTGCRTMPARSAPRPRRPPGTAMSEHQRDAVNSRLRQYRQGDRRLRALDRAAADALRPLCHGRSPPARKPARRRRSSPARKSLGLKLFIGKANCVTCHNGPRFTDDISTTPACRRCPDLPPDRGRVDAVCAGRGRSVQLPRRLSRRRRQRLRRTALHGQGRAGADRAPTRRRRCAALPRRPPYMHAGQFSSLDEVVDALCQGAGKRRGHIRAPPAAACRTASARRWWRS